MRRWNVIAVLGGVGLGIGLMYYLDPRRGRERRRELGRELDALWRDARRAVGAAADSRHDAGAAGGVRHRAGDLPGFDPTTERAGAAEEGAPAMMGLAGGALTALGLTRRDQLGAAMKALGAGMLVRGLGETDWAPRLGLRERRRTLDVQDAVEIARTPDEVFRFWERLQAWPAVVPEIRAVEDLGQGRSRWTVDGPAGAPVEWTARITELHPGETMAWRTEPGAVLPHQGVVRFEAAPGGSRVEVRLRFSPPAGPAGRTLVRLLGADVHRRVAESLGRIKAHLETPDQRTGREPR